MTHVDMKNVSGQMQPQKKKACYLTQILNRNGNIKLFWHQYRSIISGRVNFEKATADMHNFKGFLKVSRDPKMQRLSIENLILRESIIKTSLWVYGLVIYPGMQSKIMKNFKEGNKKRESFLTAIDKIFLIFLALNILFGIIFSITYHYIGQPLAIEFYAISYHFLMFSVLLPNMLYLGRDLFQILFSLNSINKQIQVRNYSNLQSLGEISLAVASNVGVFNTGKLYVNEIVTQSSIYQFKDDEGNPMASFQQILKKDKKNIVSKRRYGSSIREQQFFTHNQNKNLLAPICNFDRKNSALMFKENKNNFNQESNFQIDDDTNMRIRQTPNNIRLSKLHTHLQPLKLSKQRFHNDTKRGEKQVLQFLKAISLCHQSKFYYNSNKSVYEGVTPVASEEILLKLLRFVGWSIEPINKNKVETGLQIIQSKERLSEQIGGVLASQRGKKKYIWTGINLFNASRKLYSVVAVEDDAETATMYCKGTPDTIMERLKISRQTQKIIESAISSYKDKQSEIIIYAKRELSAEEKQMYENDYLSLKSSLSVTEEQIQAFSKKYQSDLEFIAIVGMSTRLDQKAEHTIKELKSSGIKSCIFIRQTSDVNNLTKLITNGNPAWKDIKLQQGSIEHIKYYLNEVTNLLNINPELIYMITVTGSAWKTIKNNSEVLNHFLFVVYYCSGLLAVKFSPEQSAQLTNKIRNSYPQEQKVMGIGSCFTDLKFLGQSNISIGMQSDLPTDLKATNLDKISDALQLGPYFMQTRLVNLSLLFYKTIKLTTIVLIYQLLCNIRGVSYSLNGCVVMFYIVILSLVDLCYYLFYFRTPKKLQNLDSYKSYKKHSTGLYFTIFQAFTHGLFVILPIYYTLPNVRLSGGKILPAQAFDMTIFIVLVIVSALRNVYSSYHTKISSLIMSLIIFTVIIICSVVAAFINTQFYRVAQQALNLLSAYDSIVLIINVSIFCLAFSLFLEEIIIKNQALKNQKTSDKKDRQQKLSEMIQIIKHLYQNQDSIEDSLKEIVEKDANVNVNQMKIKKSLSIKNQQDDIKFNYYRVPKAKAMFIKVMIAQFLLILSFSIADFFFSEEGFQPYKATLISSLIITIMVIGISLKYELNMCYYKCLIIVIFINTCLILSFALLKNDYSSYILICFISVMLTQSIALYFPLLIGFCILVCGITIIISFVLTENYLENTIKSIFLIGCFTINLIVMFKSDLDTKINFIINQAFEKQANYVNDILSILVPKFIKNHLEQNKFALQQEQTRVSILFCYICNFDEIVKEEGKNVVPLMDELFRQFDQLCHNYAVQKIETVGNTYMAATGITPYEEEIQTEMKKKNQVERLLKMSIQMLEKSQAIMWGTKKNKKLKIKIGIHYGPVIIGVIGYHKPQFSLIGNTVNTTSRHCSTAEPDQIILSQKAFKELRKYQASAFEKKTRKMKGLGMIPVYLYKNEEVRHHIINKRVRIKFQECVKKVIEQLKKEGKLKQRNYQAIQLARQFVQQRKNSVRGTRISEGRISAQQQQIALQQKDEIKQNKYSDLQLKYNQILELTEKNSEFYKYTIMKNAKKDKIMLGIQGAMYLLIYLVYLISEKYTIVTISLMSIGIVIFPILFFIYDKTLKNRILKITYLILQCIIVIFIEIRFIIVNLQLDDATFISLAYLWVILQATVCSSQVAFNFIHIVIFCLVSLIMSCISTGLRETFDFAIIAQFFYFILICLRKYSNLKDSYKNYSSSRIYQKKSKQQSDLVSQLLPKHAYEKLKNQNSENRLQLTDRFQKVTMLFADIKGFTSYSSQTTPAGVVKMLRLLFEQFDKLCLKYNVYKVYTIGDCYVVLGFTNCYQRNIYEEAKNVVNMGLAMVQTIQRVRENLNFMELDMRIGIHTGTIIGGIIGTEIVRYDIYGPDVMVANKFEQFGKTGAIHISESTKQILQTDNKCFTITPEKIVKVEKLNAEYNGYILSKKKFQI